MSYRLARVVRVGVVGVDHGFTAAVAEALADHESVELVGVCDDSRDVARSFAGRHGFALATDEIGELLQRELDLCCLAAVGSRGHQDALSALEVGAHVLAAPPLPGDPKQMSELADLARRLDRELAVGYGFNYAPIVAEARRLGSLFRGELLGMHTTIVAPALAPGDSDHGQEVCRCEGARCRQTSLDDSCRGDASPGTILPDPGIRVGCSRALGDHSEALIDHALALSFWLGGVTPDETKPISSRRGSNGDIGITFTSSVGSLCTASSHKARLSEHLNRYQLATRLVYDDGLLDLDLGDGRLRASGPGIARPYDYGLAARGRYDVRRVLEHSLAICRGETRESPASGELAARVGAVLNLARLSDVS